VNIGVRCSRYGTTATPGSVASRVLATTRPGAPQPGQVTAWAVAIQTAPHRGQAHEESRGLPSVTRPAAASTLVAPGALAGRGPWVGAPARRREVQADKARCRRPRAPTGNRGHRYLRGLPVLVIGLCPSPARARTTGPLAFCGAEHCHRCPIRLAAERYGHAATNDGRQRCRSSVGGHAH
jgi:hypothetical protein